MTPEKIRSDRRLTSPALQRWLDAPVFALKNASVSRSELAYLTQSPCTRSATILQDVCRRFHIASLERLHAIGFHGLRRCTGIGERSSWVAAHILYMFGYDVKAWCGAGREQSRTDRGHIALVYSKSKNKSKKAKHA
jgi:hypothetical protein